MKDIAIKVENLSKRYRIGLKEELHETFVGVLTSWVKYPLSNLKRLKELSKFNEDGDSEDIIWAIKDVSFEVERGEILGIIGRNGAGKSTLLKILSRIVEPTQGSANINGQIASLLEVGTGFHPELTGRENIYLNGTILGMKKKEIDKKFDEIVDFSGVKKFIDTPVKRYSSGMGVRLAFSVAAHLEPEILLIDEVLAVGDAEFQKKAIGKMKDVSKSKDRTVLFVSHNMKAISNLCDSAILLQEGKIVKIDKANDVVKFYLNNNDETKSLNGEIILSDIPQKGNKSARIDRIRLLHNGEVKDVFDINEDITVQIDFTNYKEGNYLCSYIHVYEESENIIFTSANLPSITPNKDPWFNKPFPTGRYRASCFIPGSYLNTGDFKINVNIQYNINQHAAISGPILNLKITDELGSIKEIHQKWVGLVRPKLQWETEKLDTTKI